MKNGYSSYTESVHVNRSDYDRSCLSELHNLTDSKIGFIYNINDDICIYLSPFVREITGYECKEYTNKGANILKRIIHPDDFPDVICELIGFIRSVRNRSGIRVPDYSDSLVFRIKHINGHWRKVKIYKLRLIRTTNNVADTLIGYINQVNNAGESQTYCVNLLSSRENEVLKLVSNGDSSKTIALKLHISVTTVISHRKHLLEKLHVKNTAQLIKEAFKMSVLF
jgi:DNA-binding CsgD family transcriptional regulator